MLGKLKELARWEHFENVLAEEEKLLGGRNVLPTEADARTAALVYRNRAIASVEYPFKLLRLDIIFKQIRSSLEGKN